MTKRSRWAGLAGAAMALSMLPMGMAAQAAMQRGGADEQSAATVRAAAQQELRNRGANEHCVVVLEQPNPDKIDTRLSSAECDTNPQSKSMRAAAQSGLLIMTWYKNNDYTGASTEIRMAGGTPCDQEGYGISDVSGWGWAWDNTVSSFKTYNNCNTTLSFEHANYGGAKGVYTATYMVPFVGYDVNDRISSFRTYHLDY